MFLYYSHCFYFIFSINTLKDLTKFIIKIKNRIRDMTIYRKILNATTHQVIFSHYLNRNKKFKNNQFHKDFNNNDDLCI